MPKSTRKKVSWTSMKKEYISSDVSIRTLAEKYGVSTSQVANHSKKEKWVEKRKQYQDKIVTKSLVRQEEKDIDHLLQIKSAADKMGESINQLLADGNQFRRHVSKDKGLIVGEKILKTYDTQAIRNVAAALKDLSVTINNMYNTDQKEDDEADGSRTGVILIAPKNESAGKKEIFLDEGDTDGK